MRSTVVTITFKGGPLDGTKKEIAMTIKFCPKELTFDGATYTRWHQTHDTVHYAYTG
jgi:hypothetical protein